MALDYLPGVSINEVQLAAPPIAGVSTSVAAFVGKAPVNNSKWRDKARLVTSIDQFVEEFVKDQSTPHNPGNDAKVSTSLSRAVFGFFRNGGTRCYVVDTGDEAPAAIRAGLKLLEVLDDVSMIAAPGIANKDVYDELRGQAELLKDRVALLDPPSKKTVQDLSKNGATRNDLGNSIFAAFYYPRLLVAPDLADDFKTDDPVNPPYVSPIGHIAGIYARTDGERGVHKAPANAVVRGAAGLEHKLSDADQDVLNQHGVNLIRSFDGTLTVWGARTLQVDNAALDPLFRYISTRRLVTYVEQSLKRGLRFAVFEPNNLSLRRTIARSARGFLDGVWRDGGLFGATPDEAYYVRFPEPFNRDEDRAAGKLVVEIGLRATFPAEFIILRIGLILQNPTAV
ncbi:phage tail sheath family protein [Sorangium sp. So ce542]|uniref:phage tail sheath family protein n=1 Tax=Sorangium sp. So ce542 TaxID=3133316 RepID=UPI003F62B867